MTTQLDLMTTVPYVGDDVSQLFCLHVPVPVPVPAGSFATPRHLWTTTTSLFLHLTHLCRLQRALLGGYFIYCAFGGEFLGRRRRPFLLPAFRSPVSSFEHLLI